MKILWICNKMPAIVARRLGSKVSSKEGWIDGIAHSIMKDDDSETNLVIGFPTSNSSDRLQGKISSRIGFYSFYEDINAPHIYNPIIEDELADIISHENPDIVHIFGTEYPHALAVSKVCKGKTKVVAGIQGMMGLCAEEYTYALPESIVNRSTFRDFIKGDNIRMQADKFLERANNEKKLLENLEFVIGRTTADKEFALSINPNLEYYKLNETLRDNFYSQRWDIDKCDKDTIIFSQADYPIKGFHIFIEILALVCKKRPDTKVIVTGNNITRYDTIKEKLKISSYGKYIRDLINKYKLGGNIVFKGMVEASEMCHLMMNSRLLAVSSVMENSPNSIGEAMLIGLPVVSSNVGGIATLIDDNIEGLLYNLNDIEDAAEKIFRIMADDELAASISKNAMKKAGILHSPENNYKDMIDIYRNIVG